MDTGIITAIVRKNNKAFFELAKRSKKYEKRKDRILTKIEQQTRELLDYMKEPTKIILNLDNYCVLCAYYSEKMGKGDIGFWQKVNFSDLVKVSLSDLELVVVPSLSAYEIYVVTNVDDYAILLLGTKLNAK